MVQKISLLRSFGFITGISVDWPKCLTTTYNSLSNQLKTGDKLENNLFLGGIQPQPMHESALSTEVMWAHLCPKLNFKKYF